MTDLTPLEEPPFPHLLTHTFGNLTGVALFSAEGHADIHVIGGGIGQVLCSAVQCAAAH